MKTLTLTLLATLWLATAAHAQLNPMTEVCEFTGEGNYNFFGCGLSCGDFNNDGYEDILIGSYGWNDYTGKNYIYLGGPQWPTVPDLTIQGSQPNDAYDDTDQNMGDLNFDGIDDFSISLQMEGPAIEHGRLDFYWGASELDTVPDWHTSYYSQSGLVIFPGALDSLGDVNGDGWDDFGLTFTDYFYDIGYCWVYWGSALLDTIPDWQYSNAGHMFHGLGDINGDGFADFMHLGPNPDEQARIFFGGSAPDTIPDLTFSQETYDGTGGGIGDVNDDGYNDFCLSLHAPQVIAYWNTVYFGGTEVDTIPETILLSYQGQRSASKYCITHGDFNGDGISDIACDGSTFGYGNLVYVYLGSSNFNPVPDALVASYSVWDSYGYRIASGDLNGDGHDELLVAVLLNYPGIDVGTVYVYTGPETWIDYGAQAAPPEELQRTPGWFRLEQNFPNPFNATTSIHFSLGKPSTVTIQIYDAKGERIKQLLDHQKMTPGGYNVSWTGKNEAGQPCASGIYLLELQVDQYREMKKMVLVR